MVKSSRKTKIPEPTIERLPLYSRPLEELMEADVPVVSSETLAKLCGVNPAQVRKDLAYFGEFGVRGVGYEVANLLKEINRILATDRQWKLCIVGLGNLGSALFENQNFKRRGYIFAAAFDSDPAKVGRILPNGVVVKHPKMIEVVVPKLEIEIGVITTPPFEAQRVAEMLFSAGVRAILNFAPIQLRSPECCIVENVDFTVNLENLAYHLAKLH
ncbi:MAG: redox-sensing transcriptional repressor Rex [Deltaproteobacteria bacterium]|nr:redox-sensing transcriptional repressor Rex [Deltaproteobacteria bacterium]MBW1930642.1 redox-sensing transcriptional repressor Rex [Deltaproteobacteria bacterium]MBW2023945.1 redox-sensing transcriptional repressor Rex [Deltaproteobacteria bacterium]RLB21236.1 MAG: redox-sensing transcriptional repressor Rex [Deltaproteobacteria bacterium]